MSRDIQDFLVSAGFYTFFVCAVILLISVIILIVSFFNKNLKLHQVALKMLLFSLIFGAIGFGVCAMNFQLRLE